VCAESDALHLFDPGMQSLDEDLQVYGVVQPTGLMYGYPVRSFRNYGYNTRYWTHREKMNLVLSDALVNRALLTYRNQVWSRADLMDALEHSVRELVEYYRAVDGVGFRKIGRSRKRWSDVDIAERIIDHRLTSYGHNTRALLAKFLYNSLLFIDVYFYGQWIRDNHGGTIADFEQRQEVMRLNLLKVIAGAAHADRRLTKEEQILFETFLHSARFKKDRQEEARAFIRSDVSISDIHLDNITNWVEKKYYLELAALTIWSDREVHELEEVFLHSLVKKLGMGDRDLEESMAAIQGFVLNNWDNVYFLQRKHNVHFVKEDFIRRTSGVLIKNKNALVKEIYESRELMALLVKMRREKLSAAEQRKVRDQLIDILKTLPTFVIIALPGTFITLPLLLKLLPRRAFPSAFREDED
jgi:hypothetical protein